MIKIIAAIRRRPGMTHAEYLEYIENVHGGLTRANPVRLSRYAQSHIFDSAFGEMGKPHPEFFHRDSVTELYFSDIAALIETFTHPYTREVIGPDGPKFADLLTNIALPTTEEVVKAPPVASEQVKVMHFLAPANGDSARFFRCWKAADEKALASAGDFSKRVGGHIRSHRLQCASDESESDISRHFGGQEMTSFLAGVSSFWLRSEADLPHFRAYEAALLSQGLISPERSFFVYAKEVVILDASHQ